MRLLLSQARRAVACVSVMAWVSVAAAQASVAPTPAIPWPAELRDAVLRHGPWPPPPASDAGNAMSGRPAAIALGQQLFFDARLSPSGRVACASCHVPALAFADGRPRSVGLQPVDRHAPSLWNAVHERWMGWGGAADSLWAQSLQALLDPREMAGHAAHVRQLIAGDATLACRFRAATGQEPGALEPESAMVQAAKAIGAFVATLVSPRTPFDDFRDALAQQDAAAMARYPRDAQRGLQLFVGRGQCALCHGGPRFTNGEFADTGLPFFSRPGVVDAGRHAGIETLKASPYNRLSRWAEGADATATRHVQLQPRNFGEFKVPGLRHVAQTGPYMHDGQLATLPDVLRHYSELNEERLHADGERILRPLKLSEGEMADLRAFLGTLSPDGGLRWQPVAMGACR
ncbi:MAG: hypothetical protein JNJ71_21380 [Rubrivivax sp.]|nr:hypothetical protein [Rubrivivax sp.]